MAATLYWYAILLQEKRDAQNNLLEEAKVLVEPTTTLASNENQARLIAAGEVPQDVRADANLFDRVVVAVTPF